LGTKSPEYPVKPTIKTEEKAKRANKMHNPRVFCNQAGKGSNPLRSTRYPPKHFNAHSLIAAGTCGVFTGELSLFGFQPSIRKSLNRLSAHVRIPLVTRMEQWVALRARAEAYLF
jgi:hypothetical protein